MLNYSEDKNWGETAKSLTRDGAGVDIVVEVSSAVQQPGHDAGLSCS